MACARTRCTPRGSTIWHCVRAFPFYTLLFHLFLYIITMSLSLSVQCVDIAGTYSGGTPCFGTFPLRGSRDCAKRLAAERNLINMHALWRCVGEWVIRSVPVYVGILRAMFVCDKDYDHELSLVNYSLFLVADATLKSCTHHTLPVVIVCAFHRCFTVWERTTS